MDKDEVKNWIIPPNYDHSEAEAKHLIYETDENKVRFILTRKFNGKRGFGKS
jgi:hypothetical protein